MIRRRRVLGYITKGEEPNWKILVSKHKEDKAAKLQVPGGTIERDELIIDALYREIEEETGIERKDLELKGKVNKTNYYPKHKDRIYERTIFHLAYIGKDREAWEHKVEGEGKDAGLVLCHQFIPLEELPELAENQDQAIQLLI